MSARQQGNLGGLVRLRSLRERDSRIGLATAIKEEREAAAEVADLEQLLANLPMPASFDLAAFQGRQHTVEMIRTALATMRTTQETAGQVTAAARDHWVSDRSRLAAVESIVERRAAAVRAERNRRETRELDEVAQEMWRRRTVTAVAGGGAR
jgi:flagellar export protein FliJ